MIQVSARGAKDSHTDARRWFVRLFSDRYVKVFLAAFMLAGGVNLSSGASAKTGAQFAQAAQSQDCSATCLSDQEKCAAEGATEEYCAYEFKQCKKGCEKK